MRNGRARILHVAKVTGISGAENHLLLLLPALDRQRYDVSFAVLTDPRRPAPEFRRRLEEAGVRTHAVPIRGDTDPLCLLRLARLMRRGRYRLVHTHLIHGDLYGAVAAKLSGVARLVSSKHGHGSLERPSRLYRLNSLTWPWFDRVITISDALQPKTATVEGIPTRIMTTIHYGIDSRAYAAAAAGGEDVRTPLGLSAEDVVAVSVGRLIPVKGYEYLIEAMSRALGAQPRLRLLIAGGGPLEESLRAQVRRLGLEGQVFLLGRREDVPRLLSQADIFVLPTLGEGFGLVILEAMAHALPVVSTTTMAIPEIVVPGETGLLVPPRDSAALAEAMERLAADPELRRRLGEAGHERLERQFTTQAMVAKTEALYDRLLRH